MTNLEIPYINWHCESGQYWRKMLSRLKILEETFWKEYRKLAKEDSDDQTFPLEEDMTTEELKQAKADNAQASRIFFFIKDELENMITEVERMLMRYD